jgi:transposase
MHTHQKSSDAVAVIGIDIAKNTFHLVGLDKRGAIVLRVKLSRSQLERSQRRLVNLPLCLVGLVAGSGSHHIARQIEPLGHEVRLIPAQYVKPFLNETATYCSATRDRGADHLSVSSAVRGDRGHFKAIRLSRRRGSRYSAS